MRGGDGLPDTPVVLSGHQCRIRKLTEMEITGPGLPDPESTSGKPCDHDQARCSAEPRCPGSDGLTAEGPGGPPL